MSLSEQDERLLNAYLDGELGPIDAVSFEHRLAADPVLVNEVEARRALRASLRVGLAGEVPSAGLERRIMARLGVPMDVRTRSWRSLAASLAIGALLGGAVTFGVLNEQGRGDVAGEVVSAHVRALMAPQPTDVQSSDRHTVKPWFAGKLAFAPKVVDLSAQGFQLVGARIDVIGLEPAASLVYSNGKHLISVMEMPSAGTPAAPLETHFERGYLALSWSDGAVTYWAVSDMAAGELRTFVSLFQAGAES
jgi:anti-sigma factor RsiW